MAIIIPSKDIYEINNQKVVDNEVDSVEVEVKNASIINDTKNVYTSIEKFVFSTSKSQNSGLAGNGAPTDGDNFYWYANAAYIEETPIYLRRTVKIPKLLNNFAILRLLTGKDDSGNPQIKYSIIGNKYSGVANGHVIIDRLYANKVYFGRVTILEPTNIIKEEKVSYYLDKEVIDVDYNSEGKYGLGHLDVTASIKFEDNETNLIGIKNSANENEEYFSLDIVVLSGIIIQKLKGDEELHFEDVPKSMKLTGEYIKYEPTQVELSFYGDTIGIDLENETVKIGDGQHVYSFNGNELMQKQNEIQYPRYGITLLNVVPMEDEAYIYCTYTHDSNEMDLIDGDIIVYNGELAYAVKKTVNDKDTILIAINPNGEFNKLVGIFSSTIVQRISQNQVQSSYNEIIREWKNGKEVATLSCAVDDYYTHYGVKEIDKSGKTGKMLFSIGDIVVPYIFGANGKEIPMSKYKDGLPKQFKIIKSGVQYAGSPRSEILIQEIPFEKREYGVR